VRRKGDESRGTRSPRGAERDFGAPERPDASAGVRHDGWHAGGRVPFPERGPLRGRAAHPFHGVEPPLRPDYAVLRIGSRGRIRRRSGCSDSGELQMNDVRQCSVWGSAGSPLPPEVRPRPSEDSNAREDPYSDDGWRVDPRPCARQLSWGPSGRRSVVRECSPKARRRVGVEAGPGQAGPCVASIDTAGAR